MFLHSVLSIYEIHHLPPASLGHAVSVGRDQDLPRLVAELRNKKAALGGLMGYGIIERTTDQ